MLSVRYLESCTCCISSLFLHQRSRNKPHLNFRLSVGKTKEYLYKTYIDYIILLGDTPCTLRLPTPSRLAASLESQFASRFTKTLSTDFDLTFIHRSYGLFHWCGHIGYLVASYVFWKKWRLLFKTWFCNDFLWLCESKMNTVNINLRPQTETGSTRDARRVVSRDLPLIRQPCLVTVKQSTNLPYDTLSLRCNQQTP